jgi:hypothetical protein
MKNWPNATLDAPSTIAFSAETSRTSPVLSRAKTFADAGVELGLASFDSLIGRPS